MGNHAKFAMTLLLVGVVALGGYWYWNEKKVENAFFLSSDSAGTRDRIRIAVDSWVGYYPLCSAGLKRRLREVGYALECVDDQADYAGRMKALADGQYDFAVATVDSYIMTGPAERFPGVIVAVIDESKGGDALIAVNGKYPSLDAFKVGTPKIALTANSPSDYFAKSLAVHFDINTLAKGKPWRMEVDGSTAAWDALRNRQVDAAIMWEPDVSRALASGDFHRVIGTEQTQRLIVDILLARREVSIDQPEKVTAFLQQYFRVLKQYRDDEAMFVQELRDYTKLKTDDVSSMLKGVQWMTLADNAENWMAHSTDVTSNEALISTIESVVSVLTAYGGIDRNPLPESDPYRIINSEFIHRMYLQNNAGGLVSASALTNNADQYAALSPDQWSRLKEIGTLKVRPITFASGSDMMSIDDKERLDEIAENLSHYPSFRVEIRGHSGVRGDEKENLVLSQSRAEAVARYLDLTHSIPTTRIHAVGFGGKKPLQRLADESERSYNYRLPRVEVVLMGSGL